MINRKSYARIFQTTFQVSLLTTGLCILIGYPLAYFISQLPPRLAALCMISVLLPFWTSLLVRTYAWLVLLQKRGLINDWAMSLGLWDEPIKMVHNMTGTLIGMVHIMLPFLILPLYGAMKSINHDYVKAAANLGASPRRAFWTVFFPLSTPGLFAGSLMVFVLCLGFFCDACGAGRRQGYHGVDEDRIQHRIVRELGRSKCAWRCFAGADNDHPLDRLTVFEP